MSSGVEDKEEIVKESLFNFLREHNIPSGQFSSIDEIVLSYVVSILEELGETSGDVQDAFDAEGFCEMMSAYLPQFSSIELPQVCQWMFELEATLRKLNDNTGSYIERDLSALLIPMTISRTHNSVSESSTHEMGAKQRKHQLSETSDGSVSSDSSGEYYAHEEVTDFEGMQVLQEMFPGLSAIEARHCLTIAGGDVGTAAQIVIHRQDTGQSLNNHSIIQSGGQPKSVIDDQELKSRIIARYSFIDLDENTREHRPVAPKAEPKKLVRYRDNKIVSIKGERFTEVRKEDEEDTKKMSNGMKSNRQNRMH